MRLFTELVVEGMSIRVYRSQSFVSSGHLWSIGKQDCRNCIHLATVSHLFVIPCAGYCSRCSFAGQCSRQFLLYLSMFRPVQVAMEIEQQQLERPRT